MAALVAVLDENVEGVADIGELASVIGRTEAAGIDEVAPRLIALYGPHSRVELQVRTVNGEPGAIGIQDGAVFSVISFTIRAGKIVELHAIADPGKLHHITP
jgi:RNA polymerase sigma-70 factor (ECF subfamily)